VQFTTPTLALEFAKPVRGAAALSAAVSDALL
jgi:hypothetical protein